MINDVADMEHRGRSKPPSGLVHADGKLTKIDKSVFFDVTSHVIANDRNMVDLNRMVVIDDLDLDLKIE